MSKNNEHDLAVQDLKHVIREMAKLPGLESCSVRTFDEIGGSDEVHGDGERTMINLLIGTRGSLKRKDARDAADTYRKIAAQYPKAVIYVMIAGYDTDKREIWDIPEA